MQEELAEQEDIGRTLASEKFPNNMDGFWFSVNQDIVLNPFDFVTVRHIFDTRTVGIVKELRVIDEAGVAARVAVMANTGVESKSGKNTPIGMPVGANRPVRFATAKEVMFALGIPEMENPVPAGVIEMTNGLRVPVSLDISYLLGPDTAHVNAAGISGNLKTSYLFFLLQSVYQQFTKKDDMAIIIFNTKEEDLLHIDEKRKVKKTTKKMFDLLDLDLEPFDNVAYFLPRGSDGMPNSAFVPGNSKTYSFELEDVHDRLDLLFSTSHDDSGVSSVLNHIYEAWPLGDGRSRVKTWADLLKFKGYPQEIVAHKSTLLRFLGRIQRVCRSPLFIDRKKQSTYIGKEISKIKPGDVFVIDIAMIPTAEEQGFVVGDVMKSVDELYAARQVAGGERPHYILIFVDEINRFVPRPGGSMSAVAEQVMRTVVTGRSRGTILFSAQQFKSTVDPALHEETGMHIIAKLGQSELAAPPYSMLDKSTKMSIARLNRGELVMVHPAFRHPVKIVFPKAPFKG
jgi:uncharacterized protein